MEGEIRLINWILKSSAIWSEGRRKRKTEPFANISKNEELPKSTNNCCRRIHWHHGLQESCRYFFPLVSFKIFLFLILCRLIMICQLHILCIFLLDVLGALRFCGFVFTSFGKFLVIIVFSSFPFPYFFFLSFWYSH